MAIRARWTRLVCGANGTGMSCMLHIDREDPNTGSFHASQIVLFNCGDSTQQACLQSRIKLHKLSCIAFTSIAVHNICGLPGVVLALSDLGVEKLVLVGPPGLKGFVEAMSVTVKRRYPELVVREVETIIPVPLHEQLTMQASAIRAIQEGDSGSSGEESAIGVGYQVPGLKCAVWPVDCSLPLSPSFAQQFENHEGIVATVVFVPLSVSALLFSRRQMIEHVTVATGDVPIDTILLDGEWSDDVVEFPRSQQTALLAHRLCPHLFPRAFPLVEEAVETAQFAGASPEQSVVDAAEREDGDDRLWTRLSSESEINLVEFSLSMLECLVQSDSDSDSDSEVAPSSSQRAASSIAATHLLSLESGIKIPPPAPSIKKVTFPSTSTSNQSAAALLRSQLKNVSAPSSNQTSSNPSLSTMLSVPPPTPFDFDVTFLGTGSAMPSKLRANSAILIKFPRAVGGHTDDAFSMLLDSGEGVSRQLFHSVSGDKTRFEASLLSIGIVWISHHHADHLCGLPQLVANIYRARWRHIRACARKKRNAAAMSHDAETKQYTAISDWPRVIVYASASSIAYIEYALNVSGLDEITDIQPLTNTVFAGATFPVYNRSQGRIQRLRSVAVYHCRESYGLVLDLWNGFKFVYSGDCRPSEALMGAGSDCDLLIHEATFADNCADHAVIKKHCTVSEALAVASSMRVKQLTILTHFSQRYAIRPLVIPDTTSALPISSSSSLDDPAGLKIPFAVAFDFLRFSFPSHCSVLPDVTASLGEALERVNAHLQKHQQLDT